LRIVALALTAWAAWRWFRFVVGIGETFVMPQGAERRLLRQRWVGFGALSVFLTVVAILLWASELGRQPGAAFIGFLAAAVMCSLVVAIIVKFMSSAEGVRDRDDGGTDDDHDQSREDAEQ
jgi:hypothetical protein